MIEASKQKLAKCDKDLDELEKIYLSHVLHIKFKKIELVAEKDSFAKHFHREAKHDQ